MRGRLHNLLQLALVLALAVIVVTIAGLAVGPQLVDLKSAARSTPPSVQLDELSERSAVYAADGTLLAVLREEENRLEVPLDQIPQHVIDAVLAVEDADFWNHKGVNMRSWLRALVANVESGEVAQGGSTITQQLVKDNFLTREQSFDRKVREALLAAELEKKYSKDEILERYLNTVYLANHSYGFQAAAETYFGIPVTDLDVGQAALLAGMIRSPIDYNPLRFPDRAAERRRIALTRMVAEGYIDEEEAAFHNEAPLPTEAVEFLPPPDDYFVEEVKLQLLSDVRLGAIPEERFDAVFKGGLQIHTTLDPARQAQAEAARNDVVSPFALEGRPALFRAGVDSQGVEHEGTVAMATVEPSSGAVRAIVGGPGFGDDYKFNLATQGYRQTGSAFKTFVLLAMLELGYSPDDRVSGVGPCRFVDPTAPGGVYTVQNFGNSGGFVGTITSITTASSNCGYVRLGQIAGLGNVVDLAGELGLKTRGPGGVTRELDPRFLSTPLGTQEVTPLDMAAAYAAIANDGVYNPPYFIERVLDRNGEVIFQHRPEGYQAFGVDTAHIAADVLLQNVLSGTGGNARVPGHDVGGKTGTAQDSSNAWFVGFSEHLATAVWMGAPNTNDVGMRNVGGRSVTGGSYPAMIFGHFMRAAHQVLEPITFPPAPLRQPARGVLSVPPGVEFAPPPPPAPESAGADEPAQGDFIEP